jgi:membrane protease YdiL (CAAX protease family)
LWRRQPLLGEPYLISRTTVRSSTGYRVGMTRPGGELDPLQRRTLRLEVVIVLAVTFGLSAVSAGLELADAVLSGLSSRIVALNPMRSKYDLINLGLNLTAVAQLVAWGALGVYLLRRSGFGLDRIGLTRPRWRTDALGGLALAALIGLPGLGLYIAARLLGLSVTIQPSALHDTSWRVPVLILAAVANAWAEEVVVVAYLLTRLRELGFTSTRALVSSSLLRGAYHLYQGFGAGLGNLVMGLVFGFVWLRYGRLWPLIIAHGIIDSVAFVGYALAARHLGWLP